MELTDRQKDYLRKIRKNNQRGVITLWESIMVLFSEGIDKTTIINTMIQ